MSLSRGIVFLFTIILASCSVTKYVPEHEYLLSDVKIVSHNLSNTADKAAGYVRQRPNSKWFGAFPLPLKTYSFAGRDSTKWHNRMLKKLGDAPVIYSAAEAEISRGNIEKMLHNDGYLKATVDLETQKNKPKKIEAIYYLHEGERYKIVSLNMNIQDSVIAEILKTEAHLSLLKVGMPFSVNTLNGERERITNSLKNKGYYRFSKDYISFVADTASRYFDVHLTMNLALYRPSAEQPALNHKTYRIGDITFISNIRWNDADLSTFDSIRFNNYTFRFDDKLFLRPMVLYNHNYLEKGELYSQRKVDRTYNSLVQLNALRYATIRLQERPDTNLLDCYLMFERNKRRSISFELEGTNTAGDLGAACSVTFSDKNLFRGSELLTLKAFGAYEAISGLKGYTGDSYFEYGAELGLRLSGGLLSSIIPADKRLVKSATQLSFQFNSQERPEFERRILSASWSYLWSKNRRVQHKLDILDISYIYMPWISETFKHDYLDSISNRNSILKYNYENLLITKMGYSYSYNSSYGKTGYQPTVFSLRFNVESSGNVLRGINAIFGGKKDDNNQYTLMNIAYAQYVKGDIDLSTSFNFDSRNSLIFHLGVGIAYPYGNSTMLPFEKRYFSGGANSMRGWSVRGLGPGSFVSTDKNIDFINQSGDMKLDVNIEYRSYLFWKIHSALFVDAGNIWTLRSYDEQPGGQFKIHKFIQELAFSYGMGLRFELDFFVFRLDAGMKAINPAYSGKDKYPIINPNFSRDFALHFAVGYPF